MEFVSKILVTPTNFEKMIQSSYDEKGRTTKKYRLSVNGPYRALSNNRQNSQYHLYWDNSRINRGDEGDRYSVADGL